MIGEESHLGRKIQEFKPNAVLATAIYSGLSALVWLARKRKNKHTEALHEKMNDTWETVQENRQVDHMNFLQFRR